MSKTTCPSRKLRLPFGQRTCAYCRGASSAVGSSCLSRQRRSRGHGAPCAVRSDRTALPPGEGRGRVETSGHPLLQTIRRLLNEPGTGSPLAWAEFRDHTRSRAMRSGSRPAITKSGSCSRSRPPPPGRSRSAPGKDDRVRIGYQPRPLPVQGDWKPIPGSKSWQIRLTRDVPEDFLVLLDGKAILTWPQDRPPPAGPRVKPATLLPPARMTFSVGTTGQNALMIPRARGAFQAALGAGMPPP